MFGNDVSGICYNTTIGSSSPSNCPYGLAYIPRPGDIEFASGTKTSVEQQFFDFINGNKYLRDQAGGVAGRNSVDAGWSNPMLL